MSDNDNDFENKVREIMLPIQLPLSTIGQISLQKASHAIEELGTEQHPITSDNHPKLHADMFLASLHAELMGQDLGDWQIADPNCCGASPVVYGRVSRWLLWPVLVLDVLFQRFQCGSAAACRVVAGRP